MQRPLDIAQDGGLFPREELLRAVADADWRERSVPPLGLVCLAIGLALCALAAPIHRPWVALDVASTLVHGAPTHLHLPGLVARALTGLGLPVESAWLLVAAVGAGAAPLALFALARTLGVGPRLALGAALVAAALPTSTLGAVLPVAHGFGVMAASLVLREALAARPPRWLVLGLAAALHPEAACLVPLVLIGRGARVGSGAGEGGGATSPLRPSPSSRSTPLLAAAAAAITAGSLLVAVTRVQRVGAVAPELLDLGPGGLASLFVLAPAALGALLLFTPRSHPGEEAAAPRALVAAVPVALLAVGTSALILGRGWPGLVTGEALTPLALLGLANVSNRCADPGRAARVVLGAAGFAVIASLALQLAARASDQGAAVTALQRTIQARGLEGALQATEVAPLERYLLYVRFGAPLPASER
jgi:hypothetical protein